MPEGQASRLAVLGTVVFYMIVAISMTLLNKSVLSSTPLPVFLLLCQSTVAVSLLGVANMIKAIPISNPRFEPTTARKLVPLVLVNITGLIFNNYCLQFIDASFHQVARGLVLPFTILVSILALRQYPSILALGGATIVTSGFFSGVLFDPNHASSAASAAVSSRHSSMFGITFGILSSVASACHAVLIKQGLATVQGSPITLAYYNNLMSALVLIPVVYAVGEGPGVLRMLKGDEAGTFFAGAAVTGVFGFLISVAAILSIKVTSPVTHMISSAARGVLQTILAVYFFGDVLSMGRVISIFMIISGSMLYVYAKTDSKPETKRDLSPAPKRDLEHGREENWKK